MDYKRLFLYLLLAFAGLQVWNDWQKDYPPVAPAVSNTASTTTGNTTTVPTISNNSSSTQQTNTTTTTTPAVVHQTSGQLITVTTDVIEAKIDTLGGNIVQVKLLKYPTALNSTQSFTLLDNDPANFYAAQSGLTGSQGPDTSKGQVLYTSTQNNYQLPSNQNNLQVKLSWQDSTGLIVSKIYNFSRDKYVIQLDYQIDNKGTHTWSGNFYTQLQRKNVPAPHSGLFNTPTYLGAAISSPENPYQKISFAEMQKAPVQQQITGGWAAMIQHYFVSAWIPPTTQTSQYYSHISDDGLYTIGMLGPQITVAPGQQTTVNASLYSGPEITDYLRDAAHNLDLTVDFGKLWFISSIILTVMKFIYHYVGNWGWSIIIVTLLIKLAFYHLSATSYRSMANMRQLQPRIEALKERFGEDKQKFSQELMGLYKKEKINPLGGCLPIVVQIPVFLGLYWVLIESVELRHSPFIFWLHDLSAKDPYYVLPILMGLTMVLQQRLSPTMPDPVQAKMMMLLPIVFTVLFMTFPSGLVLYWLVNNALSILQQWYITRKIENAPSKNKANKSGKLAKNTSD